MTTRRQFAGCSAALLVFRWLRLAAAAAPAAQGLKESLAADGACVATDGVCPGGNAVELLQKSLVRLSPSPPQALKTEDNAVPPASGRQEGQRKEAQSRSEVIMAAIAKMPQRPRDTNSANDKLHHQWLSKMAAQLKQRKQPDSERQEKEVKVGVQTEARPWTGFTIGKKTPTTTSGPKVDYGTVDEMYTYGAPATASPPMENLMAPDRCFGGLRSYTEDIFGAFHESKQVDAAAMNNYFPHAKINTACLHWDEDSFYVPCSGSHPGEPAWPQRGGAVYEEWRLHDEADYTDRLNVATVDGKSVVGQEPFVSATKFVILAYKSYDTVDNTKKAIADKLPGWHLVAREVDTHGADEDPVMVVQDSETLDCALVFTGTNSFGELTTSTTQYGSGYCGFDNVHVGYRNEVWTIMNDVMPALRPKLAKCKKVICVGHSLGGAMCEVFAACANSGRAKDPDFQNQIWVKGEPELMPEI